MWNREKRIAISNIQEKNEHISKCLTHSRKGRNRVISSTKHRLTEKLLLIVCNNSSWPNIKVKLLRKQKHKF